MASKATTKELQDLWVSFARDAMSKYELPDGKLDNDEIVDDQVDMATKYADSMLDAFEDRFVSSDGGKRRRRKKDDEDEDEDDDE